MDKEKIKKLQQLIDNSNHIVFFGGAGVSTESGIKDFRSKDGLYKLHSKYGTSYEEMLSHHYFFENTKTFYKFYYEFMINKEAKPNEAHKYLAKLEQRKKVCVITQNIDGLHQLAGSKNVLELHGSVHRNTCLRCGEHFSLDEILELGSPYCPHCKGLIKPDVVLYEEGLDMAVLNEAIFNLTHADLLIIAGTSLSVYPASGLIHYYYGKNLVVINKEPLNIGSNSNLLEINEPVGEVFRELK